MPPVVVDLGRDCTISVGATPLTGVRGVTVTATRSEIEVALYSQAEAYTLAAHRSVSVEIETIARGDAALLKSALDAPGTPVVVSASNASGSFTVVSLSASEPLDDVVVYTATLKRTLPNA